MNTIFMIVSALHNIVRWVVVILALVALLVEYRGWLSKQAWSPTDRKVGTFFTSALDTQMLLGIILLLLPLNGLAFSSVKILNSGWIEHIIPMVVGIVVAHVAFMASRRGTDPAAQHRLAALGYTLSILIIIVSIPWYLRLFPGLG